VCLSSLILPIRTYISRCQPKRKFFIAPAYEEIPSLWPLAVRSTPFHRRATNPQILEALACFTIHTANASTSMLPARRASLNQRGKCPGTFLVTVEPCRLRDCHPGVRTSRM